MVVRISDDQPGRPFSLKIFLFIVFALSWPIMIIKTIWNPGFFWTGYILLLISMFMVAVGTFIAGRYVFKDGFKDAGWSWGKPIHYILIIGLSLLLYVIPAFIGLSLGLYIMNPAVGWFNFLLMMIGFSLISLIGGFGEEFGWRGYMLPHLAQRYSNRKAVIYHGIIWWFWHTPYQITLYISVFAGSSVGMLFVFMNLILSTLFAVSFAYVWVNSKSLAVTSVYHSTGDAFGQSVQDAFSYTQFMGLGWWTPIVTGLIGVILLWKGNWRKLDKFRKTRE